MKINPKSQKGAITLVVLVGMLFLTAFLMSMYIAIANRAQNSAETTKQIQQQYNNLNEANAIYDSYFADTDIIPIYTKEQLAKIGSEEQVLINNKVYTFSVDGYYTIQNDLELGGVYNENTETWSGTEWTPLTNEFTGTLDGLGHTITGLYINNSEDNQGLFGTLKGTVKNLNIKGSYIKGNSYVGSIAGKNEGEIINCYNTSAIIGNTNVTGGYFKSVTTGNQIEVWSDDVLEENVYFVSGSYMATVPRGFKVSRNVLEQTIEDGMVIQDENENEFVWVPVTLNGETQEEKEAYFETIRTDGYRNGTLQTYVSLKSAKDVCSSGYEDGKGTEEALDYNEMKLSVIKNNGFYIGRYEAGAQKQDENGNIIARTKISNGTSEMVVKRDQYPYIFVGWGSTISNYKDNVVYNELDQGLGALALSKQMYENQDVGVKSTLCYGVQWDAMLAFVEDEEHSISSSGNWGNHTDNSLKITRTTAKYTTNPNNDTKWISVPQGGYVKTTYIICTTGASDSFAAKNIYDVAGNVQEWTNEAYSTDRRIMRGGYYSNQGLDVSVSSRVVAYPEQCDISGFRPALYIKD